MPQKSLLCKQNKPCPTNSESPTGSKLLSQCRCKSGFSGPPGGTCSAVYAAKQVEYKATLAMTAAQFTTDKRDAYIAATALSLKVPIEDVSIGAIREVKKVKYKATLAMTTAQFTTSKRTAYISATARSLSVPVTDVSIGTITEVNGGRRLLATEIQVETIIAVSPDVVDPVATADAITLAASDENIITALASVDITATVTDQPVTTTTSEVETIITVSPDEVDAQAAADAIILAATPENLITALDSANITATVMEEVVFTSIDLLAACAAGTYGVDPGSGFVCVPCGVNQYSDAGAGSCSNCPFGMISPVGSTIADCKCADAFIMNYRTGACDAPGVCVAGDLLQMLDGAISNTLILPDNAYSVVCHVDFPVHKRYRI